MKLSDRLRIALGALFRGEDTVGRDMEKSLHGASGVKATQIISYDKAKSPPARLEPLIKNGWRRNELIFACVSKRANTASQVALRVVTAKDRTELPAHPLRTLLAHPNPYMTETNFWASIVILQDFAGNMYFEKVRSQAGRTVELWPMRPDWVRVIVDKDGMPVGYTYTPPGLAPIPYNLEDVIAFRLYDPLNEYFGYPPVAVAARVGDLDNGTTDYIRMVFEKGGVPPGILTTTQPINETIAMRIRAMYREQYGGVNNWDAPMVLGYDTKYQPTGLGFEQMGLDILDQRAEVRICMTLKVPAVLVGSRIGLARATLDNVKEYQRNWWDNDLLPLYKGFADVIRDQLLPEFGVGIDVDWDFDEVPALQEDQVQRRTQALEGLKAGAITRNQFNEIWGLDDLGPRGDVYIMTQFQIEVPMKKIKDTTVPETQVEEEDDEGTDEETDDDEEDEKYLSPLSRPGVVFTPEQMKIIKSLYRQGRLVDAQRVILNGLEIEFGDKTNFPNEEEAERVKSEKRIKKTLVSYFKGELKRIQNRVEDHTRVRQPKALKQLPVGDEFWDEEGEKLFEVLFPDIKKAAVSAVGKSFADLSVQTSLGVSWDLVNESAIAWADTYTRSLVRQITKTSMSGFLKEFEDWVRSGDPLPSLIQSLGKYYDPVRAEMIAVTETTRAFAEANLNFWKNDVSIVTGFDVITAEDVHVEEICMDMASKNPHGFDDEHPPYHVRCRCAVRPVVKI